MAQPFAPGMTVRHPFFGLGTIREIAGRGNDAKITVEFSDRSRRHFPAAALAQSLGLPMPEDAEPLGGAQVGGNDEEEGGTGTSLNALRRVMREVLEDMLGLSDSPLGDRWIGGKILLVPRDESMKPKEISMEAFFHKIVMVRDRLRVLEQNINSHAKLDDADRVHLQQYITRIYGTLTTFNVLFKHKDDWFQGTGGD